MRVLVPSSACGVSLPSCLDVGGGLVEDFYFTIDAVA